MSLGPTSQARRGIAVPAASVSSWGSALGLDIQLYIHGTPRWRSAILRLRREARDVRDGAQVILQRAGLPAEAVVVLLAQLAELQVSLHGEDTVGLIPVGRIVLAPLPLVLQLMDLQAHALLLLALAGVVLELTHPEWRRQLFQLPRQPRRRQPRWRSRAHGGTSTRMFQAAGVLCSVSVHSSWRTAELLFVSFCGAQRVKDQVRCTQLRHG